MERFKLQCTISGNSVELQFDTKKMPDEKGPSYMVSMNGIFSGYVAKDHMGNYKQLMNSNFTEEDMLVIKNELLKIDPT